MNSAPRPGEAAHGGMSGATRMHDPSEAAHDRVRRRAMNIALIVIVLLNIAHWQLVARVRGWDWLSVALLVIAAMPLGLGVKVFELRFKMAREERRRALREVPARRQVEFAVYACLMIAVVVLDTAFWPWALLGVWLCDFVTYYHDRPERMRHLYAVTKTLDELREFPAPWAWALPAVVFEVCRRLM